MIKVEITEYDIFTCLRNMKEKPYELALCRSLDCEKENLEIKHDKIIVWFSDDSDYITFTFINLEEKDNFAHFVHQWDNYVDDESIEEFNEPPMFFVLNDNNDDISSESKYWTATHFNFENYEDEIYSKKHYKKHFDDEDF